MSVLPSLSPPSKRTSARPLKPSTGVSAMRPSTTLTTPPIAPEPYSRVEGPLSTSIWLARNGSIAGEWSWLTVETSCVERPSRSTATRGPSRPRMIGRPTPGPKLELCTPGRLATVSPRLEARTSSRRSPASTSTGRLSSPAASRSGLAVTTTLSRSLIWRPLDGVASCRVSELGGVCGSAGTGVSSAMARAGISTLARASVRVERRSGEERLGTWLTGLYGCYFVSMEWRSLPAAPTAHTAPA